jgi:hypothetical protein
MGGTGSPSPPRTLFQPKAVRQVFSDLRDLLRALELPPADNPALQRFPLLSTHHARRLRQIANAVRHDEDDHWSADAALHADQLVRAILACALPEPQVSFSAVSDHHEELFWLDAAGSIWHRWFPDDADDWSTWTRMDDAPPATGVATASPHNWALHLFLANFDGRIEQRGWGRDHGWETSWTSLSLRCEDARQSAWHHQRLGSSKWVVRLGFVYSVACQ